MYKLYFHHRIAKKFFLEHLSCTRAIIHPFEYDINAVVERRITGWRFLWLFGETRIERVTGENRGRG